MLGFVQFLGSEAFRNAAVGHGQHILYSCCIRLSAPIVGKLLEWAPVYSVVVTSGSLALSRIQQMYIGYLCTFPVEPLQQALHNPPPHFGRLEMRLIITALEQQCLVNGSVAA